MKPAALLLALLLAGGCSPAPPPPSGTGTQDAVSSPWVVFPDGTTVRVDLALTPLDQARGLMFVEDLPEDRGMLFLFDTDEVRPFWMKNCKIALDLLWLDASFRIADISEEVPPCPADPCPNYSPGLPIRHVLEVNGGFCRRHGVRRGDTLVVGGIPPRFAPPS
ncbi:MAG: DUF192 domain-containing protein [Acidobacteriota bacterium]